MSTNADILIIGAGLSGLSCAYHLKKDYILFEKEPKPGGVASSDVVGGFVFDKTGHLVHFQTKYVKDLLHALSNSSGLARHRRSSWVFSKATYTRYPFQVNTYRLPAAIIRDCLLKMAEAQMSSYEKDEPSNLRDWILANFGEGVARYFMFPYNLKLWKVPLHTIDIDWVDRFIPKSTLEQAIVGAVSDYKRNFGYNKVFYYPQAGGIQAITDAFLDSITKHRAIKEPHLNQALHQRFLDSITKHRAIKEPHLNQALQRRFHSHINRKVFFRKELTRVSLKDKRVNFKDGQDLKFNTLVSSIPLPELGGMIEDLPPVLKEKLRRLLYISVFNLNLGINRRNISDKHWIYFPEKDYIFYRVGFFSNISANVAPRDASSLYTEVSYLGHRPLRYSKPHLERHIIEDLKKARILNDSDKIIAQKSYDIKYAYPLHDKKRRHIAEEIKDFLKDHGIYSIGRYGSWRYMTMEECILEGKHTADVINGR